MTTAINLAEIQTAITATREGLAASGYAVECSEEAGRLRLRLVGGIDACADCLVPKPVFLSILRRELSDAGITIEGIDLIYPVDVADDLG